MWLEPEKSADREMVRKMVGKALEIGVTAVMDNDVYYKCGGEIRIQGEGGAIGVKMTGDLVKAVMVPWDMRFVETLRRLGVNQKFYCTKG